MRGTDQLGSQHPFLKVGESKTRGHRFKVRGERYKRVQRGIFFSQDGECLEQAARGSSRGGYNVFKKHLDSYMGTMGIEGYGPNAGNWD